MSPLPSIEEDHPHASVDLQNLLDELSSQSNDSVLSESDHSVTLSHFQQNGDMVSVLENSLKDLDVSPSYENSNFLQNEDTLMDLEKTLKDLEETSSKSSPVENQLIHEDMISALSQTLKELEMKENKPDRMSKDLDAKDMIAVLENSLKELEEKEVLEHLSMTTSKSNSIQSLEQVKSSHESLDFPVPLSQTLLPPTLPSKKTKELDHLILELSQEVQQLRRIVSFRKSGHFKDSSNPPHKLSSTFICSFCGLRLPSIKPSSSPLEDLSCESCQQVLHKIEQNSSPNLNNPLFHANVCQFCHDRIEDEFVSIKGSIFHVHHFRCDHCGKNLLNDGYMKKNGKFYCFTDFISIFTPKCAACNQNIEGDQVNALDQTWHLNCFVCFKCKNPFEMGVFYAHQEKPYCEYHCHEVRGTLCHRCHQPIVGRCLISKGKRYHPDDCKTAVH